MSFDSNSYWQRVELVVRSLTDSTTETYNFINRPWMGSSASDTLYWPILTQLQDVGSEMSNYLPGDILTSFVLDDSPGSFGFLKKFSDKLAKFTAIGQQVNFYYALTSSTAKNPASWTQIFGGTVQTIEKARDTLRFQIRSTFFNKKIAALPIVSTDFTLAPTKSLGKYLPLVFGQNVQVGAYQIDQDPLSVKFAYAFGYSNGSNPEYMPQGVQAYYVKDDKDFYVPVLDSGSITTSIYSLGGTTTATAANYYYDYQSIGQKINTGSNYYLITHLRIDFRGTGNGAFSGGSSLRAGLWRDNGTQLPAEEVAFGLASKSDYNGSFQGAVASTFNIVFALNRAVPIQSGQEYYIVLTQGINSAGTDIVDPREIQGTGQTNYYLSYQDSASGDGGTFEKITGLTDANFAYDIYGARFTDSSAAVGSASPQFKYKYVLVDQVSQPTNQVNLDLSKHEFVFEINGIKDDSTGTITSVANSLIERAHFVAKFFTLSYVGGSWVLDGTFDSSAHSDTHVNFAAIDNTDRLIAGKVESRQTVSQAMGEIMRNSASRACLTNSGKFAVWTYGSRATTAAIIKQEDIKFNGFKVAGIESVINKAQVFYNRKNNIPVSDSILNQRLEYRDYASSLEWSSLCADPIGISLTSQSTAMFGSREIGTPNFDFIKDDATMRGVLRWLLSTFAYPLIEIDIDVSLDKFVSLKMLDTVIIKSPSLPSYLGAWPEAHSISYSGTDVDLTRGLYIPQLESYRGQIEGRRIRFNKDSAPVINFIVRLLLNNPSEPT
mgnify:CR=1 FL=1